MQQPDKSRQPNILPTVLVGVAAVGTGTVFYHHVENLKWLDSIYFSVITLTTVGYGDIVPKTDPGKIFTIFYVLIGIGVIAGTANYLLHRAIAHRWERKHSDGDSETKK